MKAFIRKNDDGKTANIHITSDEHKDKSYNGIACNTFVNQTLMFIFEWMNECKVDDIEITIDWDEKVDVLDILVKWSEDIYGPKNVTWICQSQKEEPKLPYRAKISS